MPSLIELAAQRLEQLRRAGIEVPDDLPAGGRQPEGEALASSGAPKSAIASATAAYEQTIAMPRQMGQDAGGQAAEVRAAPLNEPGPEPVPGAGPERTVNLNLMAIQGKGILTPASTNTLMRDQYRVIKRPLIRNAMSLSETQSEHGNLIMVTSALAGEGKSFTSINLAMSIASELDHTVMLVDADVARPSVLKMLEVDQLPEFAGREVPGLLDVLEGKVELADAMLRTNVDKLTLLPSGSFHERATELLASDGMRRLLTDISTRYPDRIVIFDSPPLLLTTEARVLASQMGQVVVVVHAEKTGQAAVQNALATIEACPTRMLLLNQARTASSVEGGYGYGYGYGSGYGKNRPESDPMRIGSAATAVSGA
jgi:exopolysaccharide/PEP-CTERM locus tyrosine autokinase